MCTLLYKRRSHVCWTMKVPTTHYERSTNTLNMMHQIEKMSWHRTNKQNVKSKQCSLLTSSILRDINNDFTDFNNWNVERIDTYTPLQLPPLFVRVPYTLYYFRWKSEDYHVRMETVHLGVKILVSLVTTVTITVSCPVKRNAFLINFPLIAVVWLRVTLIMMESGYVIDPIVSIPNKKW